MGNCMRCGRKKKEVGFGSGKVPKKGKGKKDQAGKTDDKTRALDERNGKATELGDNNIEEPCKVVKITPLEELKVYSSKEGDIGEPQERKILRLVLPYIPKKEWGKLKLVCKTWRSVVDGEWARMHTLHLPELLPHKDNGQKSIMLADHIGSNCQLGRSILCIPHSNVTGPTDLSQEGFWRRLLPRTQDLTTIRLRDVQLPRYFFTDFLPRCNKLDMLEIHETPQTKLQDWNDHDRQKLRSTIDGMKQLSYLHLALTPSRLPSEGLKLPSPSSREINIGRSTPTRDDRSVLVNSHPSSIKEASGEVIKPVSLDCGTLTSSSLKTLARGDVTHLTLDLDLDQLRLGWSDEVRNGFSALTKLRELRVNIVTKEHNVYETLQTLALILNTVSDHCGDLTTLKLFRLPDPMGIDKAMATEFTTAFVKLNDETQLDNLHVCVLAPQELFHVWSLPWPALTRLRTLTLTDCNLYPQRPRGIDLESMKLLSTLTLCSDSLDDNMVMRVFAHPNASISKLTLEPGPKGIGRKGMRTVAVACHALQHLTISYSRMEKARTYRQSGHEEDEMDYDGWVEFFRLSPHSLETVTLIDIDQRYMNDTVGPAAAPYTDIRVRPIYQNVLRTASGEYRS